jgi:hypothetical protein
MIELTDAMKEKLDNPQVIKDIANDLLINFGHSNFYELSDGHSPSPDFFGFEFNLSFFSRR